MGQTKFEQNLPAGLFEMTRPPPILESTSGRDTYNLKAEPKFTPGSNESNCWGYICQTTFETKHPGGLFEMCPPSGFESASGTDTYQPRENQKLSADLSVMTYPPLISESAQSDNYQPMAGLRETDFWGFFCQTEFENNLPTELSELSDKSNISKPNFEQKQPVSLVCSSEMPFPTPESLESTKDSRNSDLYQTRSEHKTPVSPSERSAEHLRASEDFGQSGDTQMHPSLIDEIRNASSQETSSGETEIQSTDEPIIEEVQIETECGSSRTPAEYNTVSETRQRATTPEVIDANNMHLIEFKNMSTQLDHPSSALEMLKSWAY
ncbi:hypothetical protein WMY93_030290 [Mugilogobius chulae]|uniref:Uncharacterized protein n=1 Tax=Mugilogobius chulae TaxID=88201 RepID=A0AAW0MRR1_9GOBI